MCIYNERKYGYWESVLHTKHCIISDISGFCPQNGKQLFRQYGICVLHFILFYGSGAAMISPWAIYRHGIVNEWKRQQSRTVLPMAPQKHVDPSSHDSHNISSRVDRWYNIFNLMYYMFISPYYYFPKQDRGY